VPKHYRHPTKVQDSTEAATLTFWKENLKSFAANKLHETWRA